MSDYLQSIYDEGYRDAINTIVKHGKWAFDKYAPSGPTYICSYCKKIVVSYEAPYEYCPRCGAVMDGEDD